MAIVVVDLDTSDTLGPFETPKECLDRAERAGMVNYQLWEAGQMIQQVGVKPKRKVADHGQSESEGI